MSRKPDPCTAKDHAKLRNKTLEEAAKAVEKIVDSIGLHSAHRAAGEIRGLKAES